MTAGELEALEVLAALRGERVCPDCYELFMPEFKFHARYDGNHPLAVCYSCRCIAFQARVDEIIKTPGPAAWHSPPLTGHALR